MTLQRVYRRAKGVFNQNSRRKSRIGCPILPAFFAGEPALSAVEGVGILTFEF
jgi:hypothetical protein